MNIPQYIISHGKLVPAVRPLHNRAWLVAFVLLLIIGLSSALGICLLKGTNIAPKGMVIISQKTHETLLAMERQYSPYANNDLLSYESIESVQQLSKVFDAVFSDVRLTPEKKQAYLLATSRWAAHYSIPPLLILSIIWRESFFDESTLSKANARGPMQVIYKHHPEKLARLGKAENDLHEIDTGVRVGVEILREYFDRYDRDIFQALFAYVGGQYKKYAQDILTRYFNARIFFEEQQI